MPLRSVHFCLIWVLILTSSPAPSLHSQSIDGSEVDVAKNDSLLAPRDTSGAPDGIDTLIFYGADTTEGTLDNSTIVLKNNAWVKYRTMEIRAAVIIIDQPRKLMTAQAAPDSVDDEGTVVRYRGMPQFSESGQAYFGQIMEYNFETRRGRVILGETKMQDGIYYGRTIRKIGDNTLYVRSGRFTTCDSKEPHFYFQSREMKMIPQEQVVAKPVVLYIHDVPVFAIPFGVFPNRSGRSSGITPPAYSETPREGRQVRNFGYYWAPNDYFDALFQVDFLDKAGFNFHGGANYAKRYHFTGQTTYSISNHSYITGEKNRLWSINARHGQTLSESSNLNADIQYVSNKNFYQYTSINQDQILNRQIRTNVSYNSNYGWGSISANLSQFRNLDNGQREFTFPNVTISKASRPLFAKSEKDRLAPDRWYHSIQYGYTSNILRKETQASDTASILRAAGVNHSIGISSPFKVFTYFNISPNLNVQETWFDRRREDFGLKGNTDTSAVRHGFFARHTFTAGVGLSTKVYGVSNPNIFGIRTFRHVASPTLSLTYVPDFSASEWGYYESTRDSSGRKRKFDRYGRNNLFAGTPSGRTLSMGASLSNVFQVKYETRSPDSASAAKSADDGIRKMDLLNWTSGISYNFDAEQFKLSTLNTSISFSNDLVRNVSLSLSMVHDFYRFDRVTNQRLDILNMIPRLTNLSVTTGFAVDGGAGTSGGTSPSQSSFENPAYGTAAPGSYSPFLPGSTSLPADVPWNARFDFNYDVNRSNPNNVTKAFGMNVSSGLRISKYWQVTYTARYDFVAAKIVSQRFSFLRDLHCWEMRFDWTPVGPAAGYFFIVQVKSNTLRDIKLQRTDYGNRIF